MLARELRDPLHWSDLKRMSLSPAHYLEGLKGREHKKHFRQGRLLHTLLLGGQMPPVWKGGDRRFKLVKEEWERFKADAAAAGFAVEDIIELEEYEEAERQATSVIAHPDAPSLLLGQHELAVAWKMMGRPCETRGIDVLGEGFVSELKSTRCSEPEWFAREARKYGYHAQCAFYQDAARSLGKVVDDAYIVAVEKKAPYAVTCFKLTHRLLEDGRKLNRLWLERLLACEDANEWPAYTQSIVELDSVDADFSLIIDGEEIAA